jgi:hypothetical protein
MTEPIDRPQSEEERREERGEERPEERVRPTEARTRRPGFARRHWGKLLLATLVLLPVLVVVIWTTVALSFSYSDGNRVGYNQKLSRKGWLCKTWEGEIAMTAAPGVAPEMFHYSVRDDSIAAAIQALEGQRVAIRYEEHRGLPSSCFGETDYFAVGVQRVAGS